MTNESNLEAALRLVREGWSVFPCKTDKTPYVKFLNAATPNEAVIASWWSRWPDALPALPCGANSLFVVDCDRKDAEIDGVANFHSGCAASGIDLSTTFAVDTPSLGRHYYFRTDASCTLGNTCGEKGRGLGHGIDTRGAGGYVIAPGAVLPDGRAYRPVQGSLSAIQSLPAVLVQFLAKPELREPVAIDCSLVTASDVAYAQAVNRNVYEELCAATCNRNDALNHAAFRLGHLVGNGSLDRGDVESTMLGAMVKNGYTHDHPDREGRTLGTLKSGLDKGVASPDVLKSQQVSGLSPEFLAHLAAKAPVQAAPQASHVASTAPTQIDIDSIPSVFSFDSRAMEFAVPGLIPCGAITMISGDSGCGKTTLITAMAHHIATGAPFLGYTPCEPRKCLYLDRENSIAAVQERLRRLNIADGNNFKYFGAHVGEVPTPGAALVREWVARTTPKPVIFVDSVIAFLEGNENSSNDVRAFMQPIRGLADMGAAVVMLHHTGKGETTMDYRGSSDWKAAICGIVEKASAENFSSPKWSKIKSVRRSRKPSRNASPRP